jgi:hypothetical protein
VHEVHVIFRFGLTNPFYFSRGRILGFLLLALVAVVVDLKQVGWSEAAELAKVARRDGQRFDCATWVHKAQELPEEEFKREVERPLTGQSFELIFNFEPFARLECEINFDQVKDFLLDHGVAAHNMNM